MVTCTLMSRFLLHSTHYECAVIKIVSQHSLYVLCGAQVCNTVLMVNVLWRQASITPHCSVCTEWYSCLLFSSHCERTVLGSKQASTYGLHTLVDSYLTSSIHEAYTLVDSLLPSARWVVEIHLPSSHRAPWVLCHSLETTIVHA